jgi:enoyl-CoA hydratase
MTEAKASDDVVRYELSEQVARITLGRPPVNALSLEMIRAVVTAVKRAADDREARAVVLSSSIAKRFSAGLDLDILLGASGADIQEFWNCTSGCTMPSTISASRRSQRSAAQRAEAA